MSSILGGASSALPLPPLEIAQGGDQQDSSGEGPILSPLRGEAGTVGTSQQHWYQPVFRYERGLSAADVPGARAAHSANLVHPPGSAPLLLIFGGWSGRAVADGLVALNTETMTWFVPETTGCPCTARNNHASFVHGHKLYLHSGHDGRGWLSDCFTLDVSTAPWTWSQAEFSGTVPAARACHSISVLGDKAYCIGGYSGTRCFDQLEVLDLSTQCWSQPRVSGQVPAARNAQTVTPVGHRLFLFGGHSGSRHLRDLHVFDTISLTWSQPEVRGTVPPGLRGHTATLIGSNLHVFGGYDGRQRSSDLFILNTETLVWGTPPPNETTPQGRQRHSATLISNSKLLVYGGFDGVNWLSGCSILDVGKMLEKTVTNASVASLLGDFRSLVNNPSSFPDVTFIVGGGLASAAPSTPAGGAGGGASLFSASSIGGTSGGGGFPSSALLFGGSGSGSSSTSNSSSADGGSGSALFEFGGGSGGSGGMLALAAGSSGGVGGSSAGSSLAHGSSSSGSHPASSSSGSGSGSGQVIVAHRAILAARSDHFRAMFTSGMKESKANTAIEYPDTSPQAFLAMLQFLYTGSVLGLSTPCATELLSLSDHFGLDGLRVLAETSLTNAVDAGNVVTVISQAHRFGATQLKSFCLDFILKNADAVSMDSLEGLADSPQLLLEITKLLLSKRKGT